MQADVSRRSALDRVAFPLLGAAVITVAQIAAGWWLDTGERVAAVAVALVVLAGIGAQRSFASARARGIAIGAIAASVAILFVHGPGTIWPIVLGFALVIVVAAVAAGAGAGLLLRRRR
jgi:hypothetical protein